MTTQRAIERRARGKWCSRHSQYAGTCSDCKMQITLTRQETAFLNTLLMNTGESTTDDSTALLCVDILESIAKGKPK